MCTLKFCEFKFYNFIFYLLRYRNKFKIYVRYRTETFRLNKTGEVYYEGEKKKKKKTPRSNRIIGTT